MYGPSAVTVGDYIYVTGGAIFEQTFNQVRRYDPNANSWAVMAPMQRARTGHVAMTDGAYIYAVNGANALPRPTPVPEEETVEIYNVAQNTWSFANPTRFSSQWSAGGLAQGKLMVYGGVSGSAYLSLVQVAQVSAPCVTGTPPTTTRTATATP